MAGFEERIPINELDPSLPQFHYPPEEREKMIEKGMKEGKTKEEILIEIKTKEERVSNLQALRKRVV